MADVTPILIKDLAAQTTLADTDYFIVGGADAKKITVAQMKEALGINALNTNQLKRYRITDGNLLEKTAHEGIYEYVELNDGLPPDEWKSGAVITLPVSNWYVRLAITAGGRIFTSVYKPGTSWGTWVEK